MNFAENLVNELNKKKELEQLVRTTFDEVFSEIEEALKVAGIYNNFIFKKSNDVNYFGFRLFDIEAKFNFQDILLMFANKQILPKDAKRNDVREAIEEIINRLIYMPTFLSMVTR